MVLLDSSSDFGENEALFVKIGGRVPDICYILLGPSSPNVVSMPKTPRSLNVFQNFMTLLD